MNKIFEIKINDKKYKVRDGDTVLEVAKKNKLHIPTLCYHPDLLPNGNCRLCLVEAILKDNLSLVSACSTKVVPDLKIKLDTPKVKRIRRINLEMLLSDHIKKCDSCNWHDNCELKKLAKDFGIKESRFSERRRKFKIDCKTPSMLWDSSKCIECGNCLSSCKEISGMDNIETQYRGSSIIFGPKGGRSFAETNCVFCGQCILRCPSGSLQEKSEVNQVKKFLARKMGQIAVAQLAPSTRYSIGELFGLSPGENLEKKLVASLRKIGFDYVLDVNVGVDIVAIEEAEEFIERFESKKRLPIFTACCPAWVRYVEIFHHELISQLTTTKSPVHCLASATKSYFSKKIKINPKKIKIVSIVPCVANKFESTLPELRFGKRPEIDFVLTVRETARLLKSKNINLAEEDEVEFDSPFGQATGAGVISGASGGVMESVLRTVVAKLSGGEITKLQFNEVRGLGGVKEAIVDIDDQNIEVAVVSGLANASRLLKDMKSGVKRYNYVEVMACPGGCLGGGGQPIPTTGEIREKRRATYYSDDEIKPLRRVHENQDLMKMYEALDAKPLSDRAKRLFHRGFIKRKVK